jgi:hypothetical protein
MHRTINIRKNFHMLFTQEYALLYKTLSRPTYSGTQWTVRVAGMDKRYWDKCASCTVLQGMLSVYK